METTGNSHTTFPKDAPANIEEQVVRRVEEDHLTYERRERRMALFGRFGLVIAAIALWELLSGPVLDPFFFSSPLAIAEQLYDWVESGDLFFHARYTLTAMFLGYFLGASFGLLIAFAFGLFYYLYEVTEPIILVLYSIPTVAIAPLLIIWFGLGLTPKVLLAAFFVFFVVFMNTVAGIRNVKQELIDVVRVMGASRREIITKIVLPHAYPYILTALRVTLPTALIGAVIGEFVSSNRGLAYLIMAASMRYNTAGTFGALIILALVVMIVSFMLKPIEARLLRWRPTTGELGP